MAAAAAGRYPPGRTPLESLVVPIAKALVKLTVCGLALRRMRKPHMHFAHQEVHVLEKRSLNSIGKWQLQRMANASYHYQVWKLPLMLQCLQNTIVEARIHCGVVNSNAEETLYVKSRAREEVFQRPDDYRSCAIVQFDKREERCNNALLSSSEVSHHYT